MVMVPGRGVGCRFAGWGAGLGAGLRVLLAGCRSADWCAMPGADTGCRVLPKSFGPDDAACKGF